MPSLDWYYSWSKHPGPYFFVPHSESTGRLCMLLKEFNGLKSQDLTEFTVSNRDHGMLNSTSNDSNSKSSLLKCIDEMSPFVELNRSVRPWSACIAEFDKFIGSLLASNSCSKGSNNIIDDLNSIPASFFEDDFLEGMGFIKNESKTTEVCEESQIHISRPTKLNRLPLLVNTSSNQPTPERSIVSDRSTCISRYIEDEASCSEGANYQEGEESLTTSLAAFIDDRSEITAETEENDENETYSSVDMMAFYRRTAHQSQHDPHFNQPPKQFAAIRSKLKFAIRENIPSNSFDQAINFRPDEDVLAWSSDLEIS